MPGADNAVKAQTVLEINVEHPICKKLEDLYAKDKEKLAAYAKILYAQARLIGGMSIDNPTEISSLICDIISYCIIIHKS
jgi:molecular chaperone HtpG